MAILGQYIGKASPMQAAPVATWDNPKNQGITVNSATIPPAR
jgi:hypothetical protein